MEDEAEDLEDLKKRAEALAEQREAGTEAETWDPDSAGDVLAGRVLTRDTAVTQYGESDVVTLQDPAGKLWNLWLSRTVLATAWEQAGDPGPGRRVVVRYCGERTSEGGQTYHDYVVVSDAPTGVEEPSENGHEPAGAEDDGVPF